MLYTIMPPELIFSEQEERGYLQLNLGGVELEVEATTPGRGRIARVISTDPSLFLNPSLQPGVEIKI